MFIYLSFSQFFSSLFMIKNESMLQFWPLNVNDTVITQNNMPYSAFQNYTNVASVDQDQGAWNVLSTLWLSLSTLLRHSAWEHSANIIGTFWFNKNEKRRNIFGTLYTEQKWKRYTFAFDQNGRKWFLFHFLSCKIKCLMFGYHLLCTCVLSKWKPKNEISCLISFYF